MIFEVKFRWRGKNSKKIKFIGSSEIAELGGDVKIFSKKVLDFGMGVGTMGGLFQLRKGQFGKLLGVLKKTSR